MINLDIVGQDVNIYIALYNYDYYIYRDSDYNTITHRWYVIKVYTLHSDEHIVQAIIMSQPILKFWCQPVFLLFGAILQTE